METLYSHYNEALIDYDNSRDQVTLAEASETRQKFNLAWKEVQRIYTETINSFEDAHTRVNWQARLDTRTATKDRLLEDGMDRTKRTKASMAKDELDKKIQAELAF